MHAIRLHSPPVGAYTRHSPAIPSSCDIRTFIYHRLLNFFTFFFLKTSAHASRTRSCFMKSSGASFLRTHPSNATEVNCYHGFLNSYCFSGFLRSAVVKLLVSVTELVICQLLIAR